MATAIEIWKRVMAWVLQRRLVRGFFLYSDGNGAILAASVTYRALFSLFAAVLIGFSFAAIWLRGRPDLWDALISTLQTLIPGLVGEGDGDGVISTAQLESTGGGTLATLGVVAVIGLLWAAVGAVRVLRTAIRTMAGTINDTTSALWLYLRDLIFAGLIALLFVVSAATSFLGSSFADTVLTWFGIASSTTSAVATWMVTLIVTFALDAVLVAMLFVILSGVRPTAKALWSGALFGGVGLVVLQQLSGLFVGGATSNPLLGTFAALIALLLWLNFSAQVILIGCAVIVTTNDEEKDRIGERFGAETFAQRKVRSAEREVQIATITLREAREKEKAERERMAKLADRSG